MGKLDGKTAIVTGAARGLGRGYALRLAELGASVAICDRDLRSYAEYEGEKKLMTADTTVDEIRALGVDAFGVEADVRDPAAMQDFARQVQERFGHIDILICNAGGGMGSHATSRAS